MHPRPRQRRIKPQLRIKPQPRRSRTFRCQRFRFPPTRSGKTFIKACRTFTSISTRPISGQRISPRLQSNAQWLQSHPNTFITIEGHADERGDIVYNLALSDIRAQATHDALMRMGVPEKQIVFATGWGKLYPVCAEADESCWAQNRRSHFTLWGEGNGATSSGAASH